MSITEEQIKAAFNALDADGSGSLDYNEIKVALETLSGREYTQDEISQYIALIDDDKNGALDLNEFSRLIYILTNANDNPLRAAFLVADKDKSGALDIKEVKVLLEKCGISATSAETEQLLQAADTNGDGLMQFEEFVELFGK